MMDIYGSVLQLGFLYAIPGMAVTVSFRFLGFPDLTPDGSFTLGAAITAVLITAGYPAAIAIAVSLAIGGAFGALTALLHTTLRISKLLSGIMMMLMLYSVSLRIMRTSNLSLLQTNTFMRMVGRSEDNLLPIAISGSMCLLVYCALLAIMKTRAGLLLRATGDSETVLDVRALNRRQYYVLGLALSNGMAALGGSVIGQYQGFVDASMGTGLVVTTLASVVMGEIIIRPEHSSSLLAAPIFGMLLYQFALATALRAGLTPADLKLATATLALGFVAFDRLRSRQDPSSRQIGNRAL